MWKKLNPESSFHKLSDVHKLGENVKQIPALLKRLDDLKPMHHDEALTDVDYALGVEFFLIEKSTALRPTEKKAKRPVLNTEDLDI